MSDKIEVFKAIAAVTAALAQEGIGKDRKNQQQGFQYRGIDDVYNALARELATAKLCILPRMVAKKEAERISAKGGTLFYTAVDAEFDFVSAVDGSKHTVGPIYGEAFDSGDKSIGKAMSYAYKAMAFMTFAIPTEGDNDPDANCHEVKPQGQQSRPPASAPPALTEIQAIHFPRVKAALDSLFGTDVAAKKKEIAALTEFKGKDDKMVPGVEDYRKLDGKRLQYLCEKLEKTVEQAKKNAGGETPPKPETCPKCDSILSENGTCPVCPPF